MDPLSMTLGIASSSVTLAGLASTIVVTLRTLVNTHRQSATLIYCLIGACKAIEAAWQRIHAWVEAHSFADSEQDSAFFEQLVGSIEVAHILLGTLQQDLEPYTHVRPGVKSVWGTLRALIDESTFRDHCVRLNLQVSSTHLLLATATLYEFDVKSLTFAGVLTWSRPQPEARSLVCDCLRPVFRKDEESAWTIVVTKAASSRISFDSLPGTRQDQRDNIWSDRSFAFIDDLLTAPVYKRLALSALQPPKSPQKLPEILPPTSIESTSKDQTLHDKSPAASIHGSCVTVTKRKSPASTITHNLDTAYEDPVQLTADAVSASGFFSSSVFDDLNGARVMRWLPLEASLNRGRLTVEERSKIDIELLDAARRNSLLRMAKALDAGADINAVEVPGRYQTALQITINTHMSCSAVEFLLRFRNVNLHVRDQSGGNLLHNAIRVECKTCIQSLLDLGLSMTEADEKGMSAFNWAAEKCSTTQPLLTLLRYATNNGFKGSDVAALDPDALLKISDGIIRREYVRVLTGHGWSPRTDKLLFEKHSPLTKLIENLERII